GKKCQSNTTTSRLQKRAREIPRQLQVLVGACAIRLHHRNLCARTCAAAIDRSTERRRSHDYSSRGKVRAGALPSGKERWATRAERCVASPFRADGGGRGGEVNSDR